MKANSNDKHTRHIQLRETHRDMADSAGIDHRGLLVFMSPLSQLSLDWAHTLWVDNCVSSVAVGHESAVECVDACAPHCSSLRDVREGCVSPKADVRGLALPRLLQMAL